MLFLKIIINIIFNKLLSRLEVKIFLNLLTRKVYLLTRKVYLLNKYKIKDTTSLETCCCLCFFFSNRMKEYKGAWHDREHDMQDIWNEQWVYVCVCLWDAASRLQGKSGPLGQLRNNNKESSEVWMKALSWNISLLTVHTSMSMCSRIDWLRLLPEHMGFWPQQTLALADTSVQSHLISQNTITALRVTVL